MLLSTYQRTLITFSGLLTVLSARAVFSAGVYVYGRCDWRVITS